jgi:hypothetical protein
MSSKDLSYIRQKSCDFLLAASTFCMLLCLANKNTGSVYFSPSASASSGINIKETKKPTAAEILASLAYRDKSTLTRSEKRILKQEFKTQLKNYAIAKLSGNQAEGDRAGLIILAIIVALGLLYLVAALSCGIACNGSGGVAYSRPLSGNSRHYLGVD